jgi:hypothetical protein
MGVSDRQGRAMGHEIDGPPRTEHSIESFEDLARLTVIADLTPNLQQAVRFSPRRRLSPR